ncbi:LysM peptidoglycan-binding domain-containing M23 family metallopeptidase [Streptomyces sp. ActVer]|uniref:LysM peptidoglycan-binding domain-containing M23 family metallopeptidase n=1 Tax=Streptomyces sp. ActVer TaxID=3014558 RepID=UPI0022B48F90|nr:LysM peptidoglycan-binding domain-containing M23 family metallopeptidase [Streptomyces sp. ActVer]MCZ4510110.1 LysM peptidoglycan-binding domain-containing M23 family metallopeptidase [Streptomyces sp. ActVer]
MPAKGKHRRPKSQRFTRSIAVAGTGGAALALPLLGATGAHAATPQSAADSVASVSNVASKAAESAPAAADKKAEAKKAEAKKAAAKTYSVRAGDSLSKIADTQDVSGGWKKLYEDNRKAIGGDPALIHPGLKLSIGKAAASSDSGSDSGASKATESSAKKAAAPKAAAPKAASEASAAGFTLPVAGAGVGTPYKMSGSMWSSGYHTGVDFVVPTGTSLKSVGAGTVVSAGWAGAYGNQVVIKLDDGRYAQYAHQSSLSVSAGQTVSEGQQVGLSGATGNVTGPHLHFEIRTTPDYGSDVDPLAYLRGKGVSV